MQPHIECKKGDIAEIVLLPGDPKRVDLIATFLDEHVVVANNREFKTITGIYKGIPVSVTSTGIGCASTSIAVEELVKCGATTLIRTGTCGSAWREHIHPLSVIIPTGSARDESASNEYIPLGFPAVADSEIVTSLVLAAKELGIQSFTGINRTHDSFYSPDSSLKKWGEFYHDPRFQDVPSPIISSDMESSILFILASLYGIRAGTILAVDAEPISLRSMVLNNDHLPNLAYQNKNTSIEAQKKMIRTTLEALKHLV